MIGIGSPFGDDRIGWELIEYLAETGFTDQFPSGNITLEKADRPGGLLISLIRDADLAILVDAMQSGRPAGTVCRFLPGDLLPESGLLSGHALGVADTLALGQALGELPRQVVIYGVEMDAAAGLGLASAETLLGVPVLESLGRRISDDIAGIS